MRGVCSLGDERARERDVPKESVGLRNGLAARLGSTDPISFHLATEATWIRIDTTFHQIDSPNRASVYWEL